MELEEGKRERCHAEAKKTRSVGGRCPTGYFIKKKTFSRLIEDFFTNRSSFRWRHAEAVELVWERTGRRKGLSVTDVSQVG